MKLDIIWRLDGSEAGRPRKMGDRSIWPPGDGQVIDPDAPLTVWSAWVFVFLARAEQSQGRTTYVEAFTHYHLCPEGPGTHYRLYFAVSRGAGASDFTLSFRRLCQGSCPRIITYPGTHYRLCPEGPGTHYRPRSGWLSTHHCLRLPIHRYLRSYTGPAARHGGDRNLVDKFPRQSRLIGDDAHVRICCSVRESPGSSHERCNRGASCAPAEAIWL